MRRFIQHGLTALILLGGASQGQATPCVGNDFTIPLAGATNVTTHVADVPSPRFPGLWQEGTKDGFDYFLFANGDATLHAGEDSEWRISFTCDDGSSECTFDTSGSPPEPAMQVAEQLKQCLQNGEITALAAEPEEAIIEAETEEESPVSDTDITPPASQTAEACGEETIDDDNLTRKLQRMLILAGADPGPVDGIFGDMTNVALVSVLGEPALLLSADDAIGAIQDLICPPSP
ncbi:hypothetical protein L0666_04055 [Octadecabacter sp. CECT 8868]|uniref:peptidoglycan-binding domain-containing protein n=1 Tax=Octadecabacter algicola TaxID=2909342 RepID=UPI001F28507C|nr:hypothetical protein [Octadecabacter algicola]MCF2904152.1 hypothetical protein [Octadecabacter algicola]